MVDDSVTPAPSSPRPAAAGSVLVVASPERAEHIVRALEDLASTVRPVGDVHELGPRLTRDAIAIVAAPEGNPSPEALLEALAGDERTAALPVLLVVDDGFPNERARRLHTAGAAVVLAWPSEVRLLPGLVLALSEASVAVRRSQRVDAALDDAVEARIAVDSTPAGELRCRVSGGTAILRGEADSAWRARRLRDLVGNVPGIERVEARELVVVPPVVPDEELDRTVRDVIRSALGEAIDGLEITTSAGAVRITGTLSGDEERRRLQGVVENVPGVTHLDARITVPGAAP